MILSLIFISILNIVQNKNHVYNKMKKGIELNVTNLNTSLIYDFSIDVEKNDKVEIQIKLSNKFNINALNVEYFGDTSTKPTSKLEDEGIIKLTEYKDDSFLILKGTYTVSKPFIYYVSFLVEPQQKDIDIIYVTINKESTSKGISGILLLIIVVSIILVIILICVIVTICRRSKNNRKQEITIPQNIIEENSINQSDNDNQNDIRTDLLSIY
jgi:hypothetical protein